MSRRSLAAVIALTAAVGLTREVRAQDARRDPPPPPAPAPAPVVTSPPVLLQAVAPEYPPAALAAGKQADVPVRITIDADGVVTHVEVVTPVGDGFDEAAIAAAEQYVFQPAEIDGKPGPITVETTIHFVIDQAPEPPPPPPPPPGAGGAAGAPEPGSEGPPNHGGDVRRPVSIEGVVVERGTRNPVPGAIVSVADLGMDATADDQGRFFFHGVGAGPHTLLVVSDGHDRLERALAVTAGETVEVRLWVKPTGGSIYETVVEGARDQLEVTRRTLQHAQLTSVPGTFGDPVRVIQTLPGVARTPFGLGFLLIRGSNPDDSAVYIDGHQVPLLFHFLGGPSVLNPELLESIDLYPGGYPARFGRSHGGVVSVDTRAAKADGIHGSADVDLLDAGGYIRAPIGKHVAVAVAGRRSYLDAFLGLVLPEPAAGAQRVVVPVYWDGQARVDADLGREGKLSIFGIVSSDRLDVLETDPDEQTSLDLNSAVNFRRLIAKYTRPVGRDWQLTLSPAYGRDSVLFSSGQADASGPFTGATLIEDTLSYRMRLKGPLAKGLLLDTGLDIASRVTRYDLLVPDNSDIATADDIDIDPSRLVRSLELLGAAVHADLRWDVTDRLQLQPGLRFDGYVESGQVFGTVDPRLTVRYKLDDTRLLKAYAGVFHQPPQPEAVDARFGNPDLRTERGLHFGLGGEWHPDRLWSVDGEVYYVDRSHLVKFASSGDVEGDTVTPDNFLNIGIGHTYGLELLVRREISAHLFGWLSYTFSRSWQQNAPDKAWTLTAFDQMHNLNAVVSWKPGGGFELGARYQLSTGRPDTPVVGATFDADAGDYRGVSGGFREGRTPTFQQVDVRAERTWVFERWTLGLYLDIQNVFNADNVEAIQWDYRYRQSSPVTGIPFLPTIGIRGTW
ncbi:MAG TPA: TonB-dependent receptor [Kofleriaceae bacterium]|nr:TonB-dependent receptor [Kofleriaceae bacterium]